MPPNNAPNQPQPMNDVAPQTTQPQSNQTPEQAPEVSVPGSKKPKSNSNTKLIIIFAVVVAVLLIVVAGFLYWQSQPETTETTEEAPVAGQFTEDDGVLDASEVDGEIQAIDDEINSLDDSADFGQNDLTNDQIGL